MLEDTNTSGQSEKVYYEEKLKELQKKLDETEGTKNGKNNIFIFETPLFLLRTYNFRNVDMCIVLTDTCSLLLSVNLNFLAQIASQR